MYTGFLRSLSGSSVGGNDMVIPDAKKRIIEAGESRKCRNPEQFQSGLVTAGERYNKVIDIWANCQRTRFKAMMENLSGEGRQPLGEEQASFNSVFMMADSGARVLPPRSVSWRVCGPDGEAGWLHHRNADRGELP